MNMVEEQQKVLPVSILVTSYNRKELLEKCVQFINERTFYPYRIIVVDNHSTDGTLGMLKEMKVMGKIFDYIYMDENIGQCKALNKGFEKIEEWGAKSERMHRPSNDFMVTTNEDIFPPMLGQDNCWLTQMIDLLERNEPDYGGLSMRIQRTPRNDIDEYKEIIPCYKGFPSVFRLMRRSDIRKLGERPFGRLRKWESNVTGEGYKNQVRKKFGFTTKIYADHAGWIDNRGYVEGSKDYFTYADNKVNIHKEKPYPEIDPLTNIPTKINHPCDSMEQKKREEFAKGIKDAELDVVVLSDDNKEGLEATIDYLQNKLINICNQ